MADQTIYDNLTMLGGDTVQPASPDEAVQLVQSV